MTGTIAFLGTGLMGFPMASNLAQAGYRVVAWNRTTAKAAGLTTAGAEIADTAADATAQADLVISIVTDGSVIEALVRTCLPSLKPGTAWVDMSSTRADQARWAAEQLAGRDVAFLDAPVSGGTKGAEAGTLAIMVGGDAPSFERAKPVLATMGNPVHVGPTGAGQMCKLANQAIVGITIGAVAEAQMFLEAGGVDTDAMRQALRGGFADSTILQQHGSRMKQRDFVPGGPSAIQLKDMRNVLLAADELGLTLPLVSILEARYQRYVEEMGGGSRDHSGLFEELLDLNKKTSA